MIADAQGNALSGANADGARHLDEATRAFALAYGDALAHLAEARAAAPAMAMGHIVSAWIMALANDSMMVAKADPFIAAAEALPTNGREKVHLAALSHAVAGHRASAVAILDRHLMETPRDLIGHYAALLLDAFQGRFHCVRDRSARALPAWPHDLPSYGILLAFYGFGLEEAGNYERSEAVGRAAAELEPYGYWPHHAVSHVLEMTGRPADGLKWMDERKPLWAAEKNANRTHIWWHKALFHVELGDYAEAMSIYDGPVVSTQRPVGISLTNATALLWRLEMLGFDAGDRWEKLAPLWEGHADGRLCMFADIHAAMTALRAGRGSEVDRIVTGMRRSAAAGTEVSHAYAAVGLPVVAGMAAFHGGRYAEAVENLLAARRDLAVMGGSHAQRDLVEWTLTEAAIRAGKRDVAIALANERIALRPESAPNLRFLDNARALSA